MTNDATRANAFTVPEITRRALLTKAGTGAAVVAGISVPIAADAAQPEHPWEKARRLGKEMSDVLSQDIGDGVGPGGQWFAEIYPASDREYSVMFGSIDAREWPRRNVSLPWQNIVEAHRQAWEAFGKSVEECDVGPGKEPSKAARRRYNKTNRGEVRALLAVCAFRCHGRADEVAKAKYLTPFIRDGSLTDDQIMALNYSAVRL